MACFPSLCASGCTGVGCHFLLQEIFSTQGLKPDLPPCRQIVYCLSHQGSPQIHHLTHLVMITSADAKHSGHLKSISSLFLVWVGPMTQIGPEVSRGLACSLHLRATSTCLPFCFSALSFLLRHLAVGSCCVTHRTSWGWREMSLASQRVTNYPRGAGGF